MNQPVAREIRLSGEEAALRILVAEDDPALRRLLALILRREGHEVVEARDGSELLEILAANLIDARMQPFHLIVCEQHLPGMPGLCVLAGLRARDAATGFLLLTENPELQRRARELDAVALAAPFNLRAFQTAVRLSTRARSINDNGR